jgi:peptidyl-prolyl cis-trans isomerase D
MFDLFRSRQKAMRYLLGGLLTLVALSMVVTLIPGFGTGGIAPSDQVIAEIGDDVVTLREVQMGLNDTLKGRQIPNELISMYAPQIVNQIVADRAMAYYAKQLGYTVTDEDVAHVIQMMIPSLFENGKFVGKENYAQFLASQNTTIGEFERQARMRAGMRRFQSAVLEGMVVTPAEIENEFRARNEKVTVDFIKIDAATLQSEAKVTQDDINATWAATKANYRIQEKRAFRLLVIDEQKIGESLTLSEADLRKQYDANRDNFRTPERVRVRHILVKTMDKPKEEDEKLKKKAEDLLKQIRGGADFAELAKKNSEDTVSAAKGGDLDWVQRGQMVKPFEDAAFSLKPKQISDVIKTEFGYHVVEVTAKEEARMKPFEEVRESIQKDYQKQQTYDKMTTVADQARAELVKNPAGAEQIAAKYNILYAKVDKAGRADPIPLIGVSTDFDDALFELSKKGDVTPVVQAPGNKLAIAVYDDSFPARQAELSEVEGQIRQSLLNERAQQLLQTRTAAVLAKVKEYGGDLKKAAAGFKLEVKSAPEFGRDGNAEGIGAASQLEEAFRLNVGETFGPVNVGGSNVICKITGKKPADMSKFADYRFDILMRLKGKKAQERKDLFEDGLLQHLQKAGVVKIHKDTVDRLIATYKNS